MKVTDAQLDEYISLYESEYGVKLERINALSGLHKLITLVMYMALTDDNVSRLEKARGKEYTNSATLN